MPEILAPAGKSVANVSGVPLSPSLILSVCVEPSASVTVNVPPLLDVVAPDIKCGYVDAVKLVAVPFEQIPLAAKKLFFKETVVALSSSDRDWSDYI